MPFVSMFGGAFGFGRSVRGSRRTDGTIGLSSNNPGSNATHIRNAGNTADGWYWIQTSRMNQARQVYCNMTDAGGGWMLVSYNGNRQGPVAATRGQWYPVAWSNGDGFLRGQLSANAMDLWFHGNTNQCSNVLRMGLVSPDGVPTVSSSYAAHTVTYLTNANRLNLSTGSGVAGIGQFTNVTSTILMDAQWSALKGYSFLSTHMTRANVDWMYTAGSNFFWTLCLASTNQTSRNGNGQDIGAWMRTRDRDMYGLSNVRIGAMGGPFAVASTVAIFIR